MKELEQDNLKEILCSNDTVIVQYGAGWCGNCKIMKPKFKKFARETEGVEFYYVDAEKFPDSRKLAKVDNLPTFAIFQKGELKNQIQTNKAEQLKEFIDEIATN